MYNKHLRISIHTAVSPNPKRNYYHDDEEAKYMRSTVKPLEKKVIDSPANILGVVETVISHITRIYV